MQIIKSLSDVRTIVGGWRRQGLKVALVPTMGNLHRGHLSLVDEARKRGDRVVVTIFVNPMQFDRAEEVDRYPRTLEQDAARLQEHRADLLFTPAVEEVYPEPLEVTAKVELPKVTEILCGAYRPGHFTGVTTVVAKLFNMVGPDLAVFGEKDYQQLLVIRKMVSDLNFPIDIVGVPTSRESSGLAMSSRNNYLTDVERERAPLLYQTLRYVAGRLQRGDTDYSALTEDALARLETGGFRPEYVQILAEDLTEPRGHVGDDLVVLAAAWLGKARLIDNLPVRRCPAARTAATG